MPHQWDEKRWVQNEDGSYSRRVGLPPEGETGATDAAADLASELGVDLSSVEGTGKDGKITKADVEAAAAA